MPFRFSFPVNKGSQHITDFHVTAEITDSKNNIPKKVRIICISYFAPKKIVSNDVKELLQAVAPELYHQIEMAAVDFATPALS